MDFAKILQLKADNPQSILEKLYEQVRSERDKTSPLLPQLRLALSSGTFINGSLLHFNTRKGELLLGIQHEGMPELKYCNSASVVSLEIQNSTHFMYALSDGNIPFTPLEADVPNNLELKRLIVNAGLKLSEALDQEIALTFDLTDIKEPIQFYTAKLLVTTMREVFLKIAKSELGKQTLKESVQKIELQLAEVNSVVLDGQTLKVNCRVQNSPSLAWSSSELQEKIEEKL